MSASFGKRNNANTQGFKNEQTKPCLKGVKTIDMNLGVMKQIKSQIKSITLIIATPFLFFLLLGNSADIGRAKDLVRASMKDPYSTKFKNVRLMKGYKGVSLVCGYINAKNSYGGYTGFKKFSVEFDSWGPDIKVDSWVYRCSS